MLSGLKGRLFSLRQRQALRRGHAYGDGIEVLIGEQDEFKRAEGQRKDNHKSQTQSQHGSVAPAQQKQQCFCVQREQARKPVLRAFSCFVYRDRPGKLGQMRRQAEKRLPYRGQQGKDYNLGDRAHEFSYRAFHHEQG